MSANIAKIVKVTRILFATKKKTSKVCQKSQEYYYYCFVGDTQWSFLLFIFLWGSAGEGEDIMKVIDG